MQVIAGTVSAFQAGHEGSIPFARSNQEPAAPVRFRDSEPVGIHGQPPAGVPVRAINVPRGHSNTWIKVSHERMFSETPLSMVAITDLPPTFTTATARDAGLHPRDLYAARDAGLILELSHGVFRRADAAPASFPDLLAVAYRNSTAIACLVSAAAVHDLTDEIPAAVQIAVPRTSRPPKISFPPTTVFRSRQPRYSVSSPRPSNWA
jgi:hypothetical protein